MANPEQEGRMYYLKDLAVENVLKITPSNYRPEHLKSLVAAQMLARGREIIIKGETSDLCIPEKTLVDAVDMPHDKLQAFLKNVTSAMQDSKEVIIREVIVKEEPRFSFN